MVMVVVLAVVAIVGLGVVVVVVVVVGRRVDGCGILGGEGKGRMIHPGRAGFPSAKDLGIRPKPAR
jgi:hypothetical protein